MLTISDLREYIAGLDDKEKAELDRLLPPDLEVLWDWKSRARPNQLPPEGDRLTWLVLTGRGFGKTRCGAEWITEEVSRKRAAVLP